MTNLIRRALVLGAPLALLAGAAQAQYLYVLDTNYGAPALRRAHAVAGGLGELALAPGSLPEGLAFSPATGRLVFGEAGFAGAAIRETTPALVTPLPVVAGRSCVRGIAAHPVTGELFWTTSNLVTGSQLWRCDAEGAGVQALLTLGGASNLRGIAIDPAGAKLYLADFGQGLILRTDLGGTGLEVFQSLGPGTGPWGIVADPEAQRVYWCEYTAGRVRWANMSGGAVIPTLYGGLANPTYLVMIPDTAALGSLRLAWTEAGPGAQRVAVGYADGSGVQASPLQVSAYGGLAYVPGDALAVDPALLATPEFALAPVSPNPATAVTLARFALPSELHVRLTLLDVQGRRVASLLDGALPAGRHSVPLAPVWASARPASGIYFLRLEAGARTLTRKFVVAK